MLSSRSRIRIVERQTMTCTSGTRLANSRMTVVLPMPGYPTMTHIFRLSRVHSSKPSASVNSWVWYSSILRLKFCGGGSGRFLNRARFDGFRLRLTLDVADPIFQHLLLLRLDAKCCRWRTC